MKILHISSIKNINGNGVAVALSSYIKYEKKYCDVAIYNLKTDIIVDNIKCFNYKDYKTISSLPGYNKPDLVVFNEVYKKEYIKLYKECLKNKIPYVVIPHGCLVKQAQGRKRFKKLFGNLLLFNRFIKKAKAIQFLNEEEKNTSIHNKKYIISGNGVDKPTYTNKYTNSNLIYIGRYSIYSKGLDILVNIVKKHKDWFIKNNVKINLYGRSTSNDIEVLKNMITKDISNILIINDAVYKEEKEKVLKNAYAFIQPSRHEGQPMGIIEALSIGIPCIVTYQTNFGEFANKYKCGIGTTLDEEEIFKAIKKLYENKDLRNEFSENGIRYTNNIYNWDIVIKDCIDKYSKLVLGE